MKKQVIFIFASLLALAILVSLIQFDFGSSAISVPEFKSKLAGKETFIVQIELEGCPACEKLKEAERVLSTDLKNDVVTLVVSKIKKKPTEKPLKSSCRHSSSIPLFSPFPTGEQRPNSISLHSTRLRRVLRIGGKNSATHQNAS